jgi:hypothetical protein
VQAGPEGIRFLLVSGKPIEEPVAWYGPIVMNTQEQLRQAMAELQTGASAFRSRGRRAKRKTRHSRHRGSGGVEPATHPLAATSSANTAAALRTFPAIVMSASERTLFRQCLKPCADIVEMIDFVQDRLKKHGQTTLLLKSLRWENFRWTGLGQKT